MAAPASDASTLRLLLDEMHTPAIADALSTSGWDVIAASRSDLRGVPDEELLAAAAHDARVIVTENVVDFMVLANEWAIAGREHAGLFFTSPRRFNRARVAYPGDLINALDVLLRDPPKLGPSAIWWLG